MRNKTGDAAQHREEETKYPEWMDLKGKPLKKAAVIAAFAGVSLFAVILAMAVFRAFTNTEQRVGFVPLPDPEPTEEVEPDEPTIDSAQVVQEVRLDEYGSLLSNYLLQSDIFLEDYAEQRKYAWIEEARAQHARNKSRWATPGTYLLFALTGYQQQLLANNIESADVDSAFNIMEQSFGDGDVGPLLAEVQRLSTLGDSEDATINAFWDFKILASALRDIGEPSNLQPYVDTTDVNEAAIALWNSAVLSHDPRFSTSN